MVREYLEASSLAGLSFISNSKSIWSRSTWISAFLLFIFLAVYQIDSTFKSWDKNPVSTDIEVLPISGVKLPGITVCPPKGSHTALNYDLIRARNITLDDKDRQEILKMVVKSLLEEELNKTDTYLDILRDNDRTRNWLEGYSHSLIDLNEIHLSKTIDYIYFNGYKWLTSESSGALTAPLTEQRNIDTWNYLKSIGYSYDIAIFPKFEELHEAYFVLKMTCYGVKVLIYYLVDSDDIINGGHCDSNGWLKNFKRYSSVNAKTPFCEKESCNIMVKMILQTEDTGLVNKTVEGFNAEWHLEYKNETIIEKIETDIEGIVNQELYQFRRNYRTVEKIRFNTKMQMVTQMFRDFINMLNKVISLKRKDTSGIKEESRQLKYNFIINERENMGEKCHRGILKLRYLGPLLHNLSSKFLNTEEMESTYTRTGQTCCFGNLSSETSDDVLEFGYGLFLMMAKCIDFRKDILDAFEYFSNTSPAALMQEIFRLHVTNSRKEKSKGDGYQKEKSLLLPILSSLAKKLQMEYQTIDAVLSTEEILKDFDHTPMIPYLRGIIDSCIHLKNCTALKHKMETIGNLDFYF